MGSGLRKRGWFAARADGTTTWSMAFKHKLLPVVCLALFAFSGCASSGAGRAPSSGGRAGAAGNPGAVGSEGSEGQAGSTNASEWYARFPLCQVAQLLVSINVLPKLHEFLGAGCSVTVAGRPGSSASLYELAVAYQKVDILKVILAREDVRKSVDLYGTLRGVFPLDRLKVDLNPFEIAAYSPRLKRLETEIDESIFKEVNLDRRQLAMLKLFLAAADDATKLKQATARLLRDLKGSTELEAPGVQAAIAAIEARVQELDR